MVILIAALAVPMMLPDKRPAPAGGSPNPVQSSASQPPPPPRGQEPDDVGDRPRISSGDPSGKAKQKKGKGGGRQGAGFPVPLPNHAPPEHLAIKDGPIPDMLAEADSYAAANQTKLKAIIDRYWQVLRKAEGTRWEAEAQRKSDNAILAHQLASHAAIEKLQAQMEAFLKQGQPQPAYDVWRQFPLGLQTPETDEEIAKILNQFLPTQFQPKQQ